MATEGYNVIITAGSTMGAAMISESAAESHTHRALEAEIEHAIIPGISTLGFSVMMTAPARAKQAIASHSK